MDLRDPAELLSCACRVADEVVDLGGAQVAGVEADVALPVKSRVLEREPDEVTDGLGGAGSDTESTKRQDLLPFLAARPDLLLSQTDPSRGKRRVDLGA